MRDGSGDEPRALGDALRSVSKDLGLPSPSDVGALLTIWPEVVGEGVVAHASVRSVRGGVLTVEVDAAPWATQLRYLEADLVAALAAHLGRAVVTSVRVVVARGRGAEPSDGRPEGRSAG